MAKIIITILFFLISANSFCQTLDDVYDLGFKKVSNEYRWSWVRYTQGVKCAIDSSITIGGKHP